MGSQPVLSVTHGHVISHNNFRHKVSFPLHNSSNTWACLLDFMFDVVLCCRGDLRGAQLWVTCNLRKAQSLSTSGRASIQSTASSPDSSVQNTHRQPFLCYTSVLAPLTPTPKHGRAFCLLSGPPFPAPFGSWHLIILLPPPSQPLLLSESPQTNSSHRRSLGFSQQEMYRIRTSETPW